MIQLLQMWALVELLGFMCLPLTITVFHNLPDRGWAFTKAVAIALLAFCVWLPLMYIHALPFNQAFIAGILLILAAFSLIGFLRTYRDIIKVLRTHVLYIMACEFVFIGMVFLLGWIRSYGPDIRSFEMFMDEGFIAAIMRSPHLPPNDMWFAGYPINYYYYAHFTVAVMAKLLGQPPSIAFNTGICTFFGLTAVNLFGVTCNVIGWARFQRTRAKGAEINSPLEVSMERPDNVYPSLVGAIPYGLLTMLMAQVLGNLAATQQWFQIHGDWSQFDWFAPSRVVDKTINEFPAFSFLLSCFHAHVLALAFTILAIALPLNLFFSHDAKGMLIFGHGWRMPLTLGTTALILGALYTMNGWDFPTYVGITLVCIALQQWLAHQSRLSWQLISNVLIVALLVVALSILLYLPFYLGFVSPSQGLGLLGPADRSNLRDEVLIYSMFAFVFLSLILATALKRWMPGKADMSVEPGRGQVPEVPARPRRIRGVFWLLLAVVAELCAFILIPNSLTFVVASSITLLGVASVLSQFVPAPSLILPPASSTTPHPSLAGAAKTSLHDRPRAFILLLGTVAFALVAFCEVVYLRDVFADSYPRMNTVFKFYFQAWALLSICSGAGLYFIRESFHSAAILSNLQRWLQGLVEVLWTAVLFTLLLAGAVYPLAGTYARTDHYAQRTNSLDGLAYMQSTDPEDYYAIVWLNSHVSGDPVIVEAIGPDYSDYAHISAYTGLPTPMGWVGHEYQWRVNWLNKGFNAAEFSRRTGDIDSIYTDPNPGVVMALLAHYNAQYLYVGPLEQAKYPKANLHRFASFMQVAYSADGVTIYKVP
jgi:YYY domain-containing protein